MSRKQSAGLLLQTVLAFGILFAGWGFDDLRGFFASPARAGFAAVAVLTLILVIGLRLDVQVFRRGSRPIGRQRLGLALLMGIGVVFVWFLPYGDRRGLLTFAGGEWLRLVGLGLYASGNLVAFLAVHQLGKQYSGYVTLQENHQLVQTGIYGVIRHPIYLRVMMVCAGLPLLFQSWLLLPALLVAGLFVRWRIAQEEKLLAEHFGPEFEAYRQRTSRFLPYIY